MLLDHVLISSIDSGVIGDLIVPFTFYCIMVWLLDVGHCKRTIHSITGSSFGTVLFLIINHEIL